MDMQKKTMSKKVVKALADMDFFDGVMLKKDLPIVVAPGMSPHSYEVVGKDGGTLVRDFKKKEQLVPGHPVTHSQVLLPNPGGYVVHQQMQQDHLLNSLVTNVHTGVVWFLPDEQSKKKLTELLG